MKKLFTSRFLNFKNAIILSLLVFAFASNSWSQTPPYYNFAATGGSNTFPLGSASPGKGCQWLVAPNEFALPSPAPSGNNITNIWLYMTATSGSGTYTSFQIRLGQTALTSLPAGVIYTGAMTVVYSQPSVTLTWVAGKWINITLTTPFAYNPTQSLIVEVTQCGLSGTGSGVPQNALTGTRRTYMTPTSCVQAYGGQDGSLPGIGLTLVSAGPCTNPPTPGTVTSTLNPVPCPTNSFTLGLTGGTGGSGQTYQWQSSPNNSTWSIITGATNAAYTTTQLASTYYRCQVTCGTTVASGSLLVTLTTPPLTGIYTINNLLPTGGTNFQTFTAAINALNCAGPGTGGVIFNVVAGQTFTEIPPVITAPGTLANQIVFQRSGAGVNPKIIAGVGTSTTVDGIIRFGGCDYVTFDGIDLQYPITNITATTQMEWGYGIVKASATDGSQNITIKNCTITLQKINTASVGIYGGNHIATSTTSLTVTAFSGTNSYLKLYNNTIQNCYTGISITGYADATSPYAYYDHFNEVGVQGGNIIRNFGGGAVTTYGVYTIYQDSLFVNNNNIGGGTGTTTTNYGIMISTGTNSCITVYNNTVSDTTATLTSSSYGIALNNAGVTGTNNTVIVKRNTVQGMTNTAAGTTCALYGFYIYYTVSINLYIDSNNYMNNKWGNTSGTFTGSIYEFYIYPYTLTPTAGSVQYVTNNYISGNKRIQSAVSTGTQYGMYIYYGLQTVNAYNNVIENDTLPTTSTNYGLYVYNYYSTTANYYNNTVRNIYKPNGSTGAFYGIYISNAAPSGTFNYYNNSVNNLTNGVGAASLYGHYIAATSVTKNIYGDTAYAIRTMLGGSVYGIYQSGGTTTNLYRNTVYDLRTSSGFGYGITVASGTTNNVYNNYISDIRVDSLSTTLALMGLYLSGGTTNNVYYNTIYLNSASHLTGSYTFGTAALYASSTPITDLRNNIAVNMSTPGTVVGGYSTAYYRSTSTLTTYAATSNNNCFYSGTPGQYRLIHFDGTNSYQTMAQYQSLVGPRDGASFTENPPFINVATKPYNLHLNTTTVTNCESGAQRITAPIGIADDWDGNVRWGEIGYSGTGAAPDVGADEGEFAHSPQMVVDSTNTVQVTGYAYIGQINQHIIRIDVATSNSYNAPSVTQFTVNANGTTDINEINLTPARIYYTGTSTTFSASTLFGSATPTLIDFPISGNQKLSPGTNYFWLAYDVSPTALAGNYIDGECNSVQITSGSLTPLNTAPTGNKTIIGPMAGNYYVGQGQTFPNFATLTDAVINLNSRGISGPTTLYLTNSSSVPYNRINGETFPIVINSITGASALSPVTIVPNTGVQPVIQDTIATCLIKFNGTDYLTLDGSNKGTNTKDLTIYNASTAVSTTPLFISSLGVGLGSTYLTIKNCNISGGLNTVSTQYGIYIGGATVGSVGNDNDYITIQNNYIKKAYYGIYASGAAAGLYDNLNITQNTIGAPVGTTSDYIWYYGMYLTYCTGANISQNTVQNILTSVTTPIGMYIYTGVVNSTISKNNINNIVFTGSGGYGGRGLYVSTGNAASNLTIANNIIYVIGGDGYTSFSNSSPVGMFFDGTTGGLNIYYNSVYMSGNLTYAAATLTATILFNTTTVTNVDCRDNIFQNSLNNTANATAKNYAIYSTAPATSFTQINYNDYWVTGTQGILGFLGADQTSLVAWQTATGKDVNSIFADPQFQTTTDLRPMIGSPVLLAGTPIAGITDDYTGSLRSVTNPTIGAYERGTDLVGPNISYVNLPNTTSTSNITTSNWATMTDASGINTTTGTAPRIYYKKSWHNNTIVDNTSFTNGWKWTEAISISSPFDFVIDYSLIFGGGVATGDNIMYFVVAQDNYSTPNISIKSGTFASQPTSVDLTVSAFPIGGTVYSYSIMSAAPLSGDYTVGLTMFNLITGKNLEPKEFTRSSKKEESKKGNMDNLTNDDNKKSKTGNNTDRVQSDKVSTNERYIALSENGIEYKGPMYVKFTPEIRKKYNLSDYMTGNYANISSALSDLYAVGMSSSVRFLLTDANYGSVGTPENLPINLGPVTGAGPSSTITILPQGGNNVIITGDNTTSVFDFNGGNYFIFDGRPNGSSTPKQLTIRNISTSNTATTMRFINDACQNKIQYCIIEGSGSGVYPVATNGTITFGTTTGIRGNDSNYVANNDIRDRSDATGTPNYAIYSTGSTTTVAQYNSDNFITDNNIFNFYNDGNISSGCFLTTGTGDNWVVTGNSFYQTDERVTTSTNYTCWNVVFFGTTTINNINVSNNYIGGSAPNCGGSPWRVTNGTVPTAGSPTFIYVIRGSLGSTTASSFQNNTVANYLMNVYAALTAGSTMFSGMILSSGWADVGTITGNTIGNNTGNGSIEINFFGTNTFAPGVAGIDHRISGSVNNNTVGSFTMNAPSTMTGGYTFNGITKSGTPVAAMTISNNTVGSSTVTNSIQNTSDTAFCVMTGISSSTATVNLTMNNNTVANLTNMSINTGTTNYVRGIIHTGTAIDAITNNIVKNLYSMSGNTSTFSTVTNAVIGIGSSSAAIGQNISGNTISGLRSATVITNNTYAIGLGVTSSTSTGTIERNRIFDITNTSTGAAPYIIGINNYWGTWTIPNNQITITNGELTDNIRKNNNTTNLDVPSSNNINVARNIVNNSIANNIKDNLSSPIEIRNYFGRNNLRSYDGPVDAVVEEIQSENKNTSRRNKITDLDRSTNGVVIYGIFDDASTIGSYYYNSVYIGGSAATGTSNSYAFYRLGTPNIVLRNNLFYNGRINSGTASGKHYAIASSGITAINPNYNSYVTANANTMGFWNASDQTFATWKTATTADAFSYATTSSIISATNLFSSISTGNLNILSGNTEAWLVSGKGTYIAGQTTDFDGVDSRSVTIAGGITDIGSDEFTATPPNCPVAVESAPPSAGIITTYTIYNRTLVDIFWSTGGSSYPTNVNVRYYSGITPPNSTGNNAFSYCDVNPIGTLTGATYDITNYFTDAETYTIVNPTTDTRLAKYSNSEWWVYGDLGTGNLQTELNWAGKWAKVRGLDAFSYFTFSDITNPLPVQLTAFTSSVSGRDVKLNWITEREQNNAGYEIQRIKNTELNSGNWVKVGYIKSAGNSNKPTSYTFNDKKLNSGKYNYRLRQIDNLGTSHYFKLDNVIDIALPTVFNLSQNYPNPFNPVTKIDFELPFDSRVRIVAYDMLGREVKILVNSETRQAGFYTVDLNATNLASGTYFYRMIANSQGKDMIFTKKMTVVK